MESSVRFCYQVFGYAGDDVHVVTSKDQLSFAGGMKHFMSDFFDTINILFTNASHRFMAIARGKCRQDMRSNLSDAHLDMYPVNDGFEVPVVASGEKIHLLNLLKLDDIEKVETADALDIFKLIDAAVYLWVIFLTVLLILATALGVILRTRPNGGAEQVLKAIYPHVRCMFYHSPGNFKIICLLYSLLVLYLVMGMNALYKTSQVTVRASDIIKNYEEIVKHETSLPIFIFMRADELFKDSPATTWRGRVWSKLINSGQNVSRYLKPRFDRKQLQEILKDRNVIVASSATSLIHQLLLCQMSPQDELWKVVVFNGDTEYEKLFGFPISPDYKHHKYFKVRMMRLVECGWSIKVFKVLLASIEEWLKAKATSGQHFTRQMHACLDEQANDLTDAFNFKAAPCNFYMSIIFLALGLLETALCTLVCETMIISVKGRRKRVRVGISH